MNQSNVTSSEAKIRLTAFFVLVLILTYLITANSWLVLFLMGDFALRATPELALYSPLAAISGLLAKMLRLPARPVYMPPKRFAARIGMLFIIVIIIVHRSDIATLLLGSIVALFAALESFVGFCAACWVYNAFIRLRTR